MSGFRIVAPALSDGVALAAHCGCGLFTSTVGIVFETRFRRAIPIDGWATTDCASLREDLAPASPEARTTPRLLWRRYRAVPLSALLAACLSLAMMATTNQSPLGLPSYWSWVLTGIQVLALAGVGRGYPPAWLAGGAAQIAWITYGLLTNQVGFVAGCAISCVVQVSSYVRQARP